MELQKTDGYKPDGINKVIPRKGDNVRSPRRCNYKSILFQEAFNYARKSYNKRT